LSSVYIKAILVEIQLKNVALSRDIAIALNSTTYNATSFLLREQTLQSLNPLTGISPLGLWIVCVVTGICQVLLLK
jgi:hypothetical protein